MDLGRCLSVSPSRRNSRKRLISPYKKLLISTSPKVRSLSEDSIPSDPGTPYGSDRYGHTTYTTYKNGTKYTRYVIRKLREKPFSLFDRPNIFQTTFKTMKVGDAVSKKNITWYTHVHIWMKEEGNLREGGSTPPSTPRLRAISDLERGQISPRRFSLHGLSSPV
jgi:hypothetical protein